MAVDGQQGLPQEQHISCDEKQTGFLLGIGTRGSPGCMQTGFPTGQIDKFFGKREREAGFPVGKNKEAFRQRTCRFDGLFYIEGNKKKGFRRCVDTT